VIFEGNAGFVGLFEGYLQNSVIAVIEGRRLVGAKRGKSWWIF
jgi:hypothetical protein